MPPQFYDWTCSVCATEYVERGSGAGRSDDIYANRQAVGAAIGFPANINATYGLMDGGGTQLRRVLREHAGLDTQQGWLSFVEAYDVYSRTFGLMAGSTWNHWVAVRGVQGTNLWIANSGPGYRGIFDVLSREDFQRLGPFSCISVED
jgi:hypothetical protein